MERLQNKVALVTGAGHGIGEEIARLFAAEGAAVLLADRDGEAAERVAQSIRDVGGRGEACVADVASTPDSRRMVESAVEQFGGLDILVNNAALTGFGRGMDAEDLEEKYDRLMAVNLKSVWMALHHALPHLRARGGGSVINISSVQALASGSHSSAYAASKGALISGTHALAVELAPDLIRVNCISPGRIWTDEPGDWLRRQLGPELHREFQERFGDWPAAARTLTQPLPVEGKPKDIAYCAVYLASEEARFCTGANFVIDGGATALLAEPGHVSHRALEAREREAEARAWIEAARRRQEEQTA
jgi:NAD(P)-dependent dehydrogenase (short-subunit alcohol dehydrogenase family)